jgi:CelD/BcsL family acetyltransferase involved in cellulose biosynthesis
MIQQSALTLKEFSAPEFEALSGEFSCHAEVHTSITQIEQAWLKLEKSANRPTGFQSLTWCQAWLRAMSVSQCPMDLRIVTVWVDGRLGLLWPLAVSRSAGCRVLHALGEPAAQYCDALVDRSFDRNRLVQAAWDLVKSFSDVDLVELRRVRADSNLSALPASATRQGFESNLNAAPHLTSVAGDALRSSRTRNALRRHERKLAEHGALHFEVVKDVGTKIQTLADGLEFKRQWIEQRKLWSKGYAHPAGKQFNKALAALDQVVVMRLTVGGVTAAMEMGFVDHGHYLSLMQSYDPRLQSHSPGRLLFWHFLDRASDLGIKCVDFLSPSAPHKQEWANCEVPVRDFTIPLTFKGAFFGRARLSCRAPLKRLYAALPAPIRKQVLQVAMRRGLLNILPPSFLYIPELVIIF